MKAELNWMLKDFREQILTKPKHQILIAFLISATIGAVLAFANIIIFVLMIIALYGYWYLTAYKECKKKPKVKFTQSDFNPL